MATGDTYTNLTDKRFLPQQRIKDTFFDYLKGLILDNITKVWGGAAGIFGVQTFAGAADSFLAVTPPVEGMDNSGNFLILDGVEATVGFENTLGVPYYAGMHYSERPDGLRPNSRNGVVEYDLWEERIGFSADPDSVVEGGGQLTMVVDGIFENGVDHSGRLVSVWLKVPSQEQTDIDVALETGVVVTYDIPSGENRITTTGVLGQVLGSASTNTAMYTVMCEGVTVRRNTDLRLDSTCAFLAIVTGGGAGNPPLAISIVDQVNIQAGINGDLQRAYENGRIITPSMPFGGEVLIRRQDASGGPLRAGLVIDRVGAHVGEAGPGNVYLLQDPTSGMAVAVLHPITTGSLQIQEPADKSGASTLTLTRVGADMTAIGSTVQVLADFALVENSPALENGLYLVNSVLAAQVVHCSDLGATPPAAWSAESVNVTFYRARFLVGTSGFTAGGVYGPGTRMEMHGLPAAVGSGGVLRIFPWEAARSIELAGPTGTVVAYVDQSGRHIYVSPQGADAGVPIPVQGAGGEAQVALYDAIQAVGVGIRRLQADPNQAWAIDLGDLAAPTLYLYSGANLAATIRGAFLNEVGARYFMLPRTEVALIDLMGFHGNPAGNPWEFFAFNTDVSQANGETSIWNNTLATAEGWLETADWPEDATITRIFVDWEQGAAGGGVDLTLYFARQTRVGGVTAKTCASLLTTGSNLVVGATGARRTDTAVLDQNNANFTHLEDKLAFGLLGPNNAVNAFIYSILIEFTYETVAKFAR